MRIVSKGFILAFILCALLVTEVLAATWQFQFPITITDTSNTTRTYYPVSLNVTGQSYINGGYISGSGLNTNMQMGTQSIPYMISTSAITTVVPLLPSGGKAVTSFYTGYSPAQTLMSIIPGDGGYVTTPDAANLKATSLQTWTIVLGNTYLGNSGNFSRKGTDFSLWDNGSGNVSANVSGTVFSLAYATKGLGYISLASSDVTGQTIFHIDYAGGGSNEVIGANTTIQNNVNDWIWMENIPVADYIMIDVESILQLYYRPNSILVGATIPDRGTDATNNQGTITWGTNKNVTLHSGIMLSGNSTSSTSSNVSNFNMPIAALPHNWFAPNDTTQLMNLPFYDMFHATALNSGISTQMLYFIVYIGFAFLVMILVMSATKSNLFGIIMFNSFLFIGTTNSIVPGWIAFSCLIVQFGIMYLSRQV